MGSKWLRWVAELGLVFLLLVLLGAGTRAYGAAGTPRTIRVVMDSNYPPYVFKSNEGKLQGILIDQWQAWEKKTGITVELHAMDWGEALGRMRAGEFDVIDTIFKTPEREAFFDFTPPYATLEVLVFFRHDITGITDLASLQGFSVGAKTGDHAADLLTASGLTIVRLFASYEEVVEAAVQRKIAVFVVDAPPAVYLLHKFGIEDDFRRSAPLYIGEFHRAVRKGDAVLLREITEGFALIDPAELRQIEEKWSGRAIGGDRYLTYAGLIAVVAIVLLAGVFGWNRLLKKIIAHRTETLRASEQQFRQLAENIHEVFWLIDVAKQKIIYVSPTYEEVWGRTCASLYASHTPWPDFVHPDDLERVRQLVTTSKTPDTYDEEFRIIRPDGSIRWIREQAFPVRNAAGGVYRRAGVAEDITAHKEVEESLRLLGSAVEQSHESILITDPRLDPPGPKIVFVNPAFTVMTGYTAAEAIGQTPRILQGPRTDMAVMQRLRKNLERGEPFAGEAINYRKDGTAFDLEWQIAPLRNASGVVTHFVALQRDITARKQAEMALRTSEQRFKALFEQAAVGVVQTDALSGRLMQVNQRFCEILGHSREELEQLTFTAITHPEEVAHSVEMARQIIAGSLREFTEEKRYLRKDGSTVWVNVTVSAMWAPGDPPDCFLAVAQDITARKKLEEQFRQAQKMEAIGTLAGGIAHDFNNILAAINGYTELAQLVLKENPRVRDYLGSVLQASRRATDLVRQILTFSRQQPLERRPVQLLPIVHETLKLLRATIPSTVLFDTELATDAPTVLADATQIHQILMNLGTNAWHAMKDRPGRLQVKLERWVVDTAQAAGQSRLRPGLYARVSVTDTGSGMDAATVRRIYEPFFTTKPAGEGTGLGLSVVHGIMDSHDGAVTVYSQLGEGTVFHLYFPAHSVETITSPTAEEPMARGKGERLLFVDDEESIVEMARLTLETLGYEVEATSDPEAGFAMVRADPQRFALVLSDQTMPGMTGLTLAGRLHQIRPGLPIILMTGYGLSLTPERLAEAGVSQLMIKPVSIHDLATAVHAALAGQSQT